MHLSVSPPLQHTSIFRLRTNPSSQILHDILSLGRLKHEVVLHKHQEVENLHTMHGVESSMQPLLIHPHGLCKTTCM